MDKRSLPLQALVYGQLTQQLLARSAQVQLITSGLLQSTTWALERQVLNSQFSQLKPQTSLLPQL